MVRNAENGDGRHGRRWRMIAWAVAAIILLMVPLIAMQFSEEWNWGLFDFVFAFILIFGMGLTYEMVARKANNIAYKAGVGVAGVAAFLLVWINAAVGIIGDDESINLFYLAVLIVGMIGAYLARFEPQGMTRALLAMAITQMLVPVIVLAIPNLRSALMEPPGFIGVIGLNVIFAILFAGSALLFRKAAQEQSPAGAGPAG